MALHSIMAALVLSAVPLLLGGTVSAQVTFPEVIDLNLLDGLNGARFRALGFDDHLNQAVSGIGDINADGLEDFVVGTSIPAGRRSHATLVFGTRDKIENEGFVDFDVSQDVISFVDSSGVGRLVGHAVSGLGDVDGDEVPDLAVSGPRGSPTMDPDHHSGVTFIISGAILQDTTSAEIDMAMLIGRGVTRIDGADALDWSGFSVSGAGDFNGDGLCDIIIGAPHNSFFHPANRDAGEAYVIWGRRGGLGQDGLLRLASLSSGDGVTIRGVEVRDKCGVNVSGVGDVNGDGLDDVIIGSFRPVEIGATKPGEAAIVFGSRNEIGLAGVLDLSRLSMGEGLRLVGEEPNGWTGYSVSGAGDFNGDGLNDYLFGAPLNSRVWIFGLGQMYLGLGSQTLSALGPSMEFTSLPPSLGVRFVSVNQQFNSMGYSTSGVGDFNGDGFADFSTGSPRNGSSYRGLVTTVFGSTEIESRSIFSYLGEGESVEIVGLGSNDRLGASVSGAGDFNGDGFSDSLMVAPLVEYRGSLIFGEVYIVHGSGDVAEATYRNWIRPGDAPRRGVGMIGDGSHSIPFSRCAIGFVGGAGTGNGGASMQTVTLRRSDDLIQNLGDLSRDEIADVLWKVETDRADYHFAWITLNYLDLEIEDFGEERLRVFEAPSPDGPWSLVEMQMRMPDRNAVKLDVPSFTGPKYFALAVVDVPSTDELLECILGVRPATALHDINGDGFVDTADVVTNLQN